MFWFKMNFDKWPKVDTCGEVQQFIDMMCEEYHVPPIKVIIRSTYWVEWFAGKGVIACAFWPNEGEEDAGFGRYIVFDGQKCRISGNERNPVKIQHRYETAERIHTIIHEFIHHYFHHHEGINTSNHGRTFRQMEKKMNAKYGIFFFYAWNNYAKYFHNFWGFPFGKKSPNAADRGWEVR